MFIQGLYPAPKPRQVIAGLEGSGLVVATGSAAAHLLNKRVAFFSNGNSGSWANFAISTIHTAIPLTDEISYEQGACALVNPLTVEAMALECESNKHTCIVHSAASSALGK
jgi:NADPH:quinone reductase